jgi:hypothetical protein
MHFTFSNFGQEALSANLSFSLLDDGDVVPNEGGNNAGSGSGGGFTMVLLVGSVFYFSSEKAMYEFLQPKVAAALQEKGLYDPEAEGPCPLNNTHYHGTAGEEEEEAPLAMEEEGKSSNNNVITALSRKSRSRSRRRAQGEQGSFAPAADAPPSPPLTPPLPVDCDDVIKAFNTDQGSMGQDATDYAFLYMCNITASHAINKDDMLASSSPPPSPPERHHLSYDQLRPADYPYSYWVFLNINPPTPSPSSSLGGDSLAAGSLSQTISYDASFFPVYVPATAKLMDPFFVVLMLGVGLYFVIFCRYVINPVIDCLTSTRWGKKLLGRG